MRALTLSALSLLLAVGCQDASPEAPPADAPAADPAPAVAASADALGGELPAYAERLLSNPYVEVTRYALPAGATVSLETGKNWVAYALADAYVVVDGRSETWPAGSAAFYEGSVRLKNAGADPAEVLFFERWANPLPDRALPGEDADLRFPTELTRLSEIESDAVEVLVASPTVGAARVTLAPGEVLPTHSAFSRVVYALNDYTVERYNSEGFAGTRPDGTFERSAGDIVWDSALNYGAANVGDGPSETLIVAYYD